MDKSTIENVVRFSEIKPGSSFSYRGEKYIKLEKKYKPSENSIKIETNELLVFSGKMIVKKET